MRSTLSSSLPGVPTPSRFDVVTHAAVGIDGDAAQPAVLAGQECVGRPGDDAVAVEVDHVDLLPASVPTNTLLPATAQPPKPACAAGALKTGAVPPVP